MSALRPFQDLPDADCLHIAQDFLAREARLLDERRFEEWYELLDEELSYQVPIRLAKLSYAEETPAGAFRIDDDRTLVRVRIDRLKSGAAWAETPPSRTLRVVGSVFVDRTPRPDVLAVESAMILYRQRGHDDRGDVIPVRRSDLLRLTAGGVRLLKRTANVTEAVLSTPNLGVFV